MGGILTWVLRKSDGETHVMRRFTNSMPGLIKTPGFLRGEKDAVNDALQLWLNYKADWEAHKDDGGFEYGSSRALTPYPAPLAPYDYGIIVTDFATRTFLSSQGYSLLDSKLDTCLGSESPAPEDIQDLAALRNAGLVSHHRITAPDAALTRLVLDTFPQAFSGGEGQLIFPSSIAYSDLEKFCRKHRRLHPKIGRISAGFDVPGLTIKTLPEYASGADIKQELAALGFRLGASDLEAFKAWDALRAEAA